MFKHPVYVSVPGFIIKNVLSITQFCSGDIYIRPSLMAAPLLSKGHGAAGVPRSRRGYIVTLAMVAVIHLFGFSSRIGGIFL